MSNGRLKDHFCLFITEVISPLVIQFFFFFFFDKCLSILLHDALLILVTIFDRKVWIEISTLLGIPKPSFQYQ